MGLSKQKKSKNSLLIKTLSLSVLLLLRGTRTFSKSQKNTKINIFKNYFKTIFIFLKVMKIKLNIQETLISI